MDPTMRKGLRCIVHCNPLQRIATHCNPLATIANALGIDCDSKQFFHSGSLGVLRPIPGESFIIQRMQGRLTMSIKETLVELFHGTQGSRNPTVMAEAIIRCASWRGRGKALILQALEEEGARGTPSGVFWKDVAIAIGGASASAMGSIFDAPHHETKQTKPKPAAVAAAVAKKAPGKAPKKAKAATATTLEQKAARAAFKATRAALAAQHLSSNGARLNPARNSTREARAIANRAARARTNGTYQEAFNASLMAQGFNAHYAL